MLTGTEHERPNLGKDLHMGVFTCYHNGILSVKSSVVKKLCNEGISIISAAQICFTFTPVLEHEKS